MRSGLTLAALAAAAALTLALGGCGGGSSASETGISTVIHVPPKSTHRQSERPNSVATDPAVTITGGGDGVTCKKRLAGFLGGLEKLRRELEVGLSYKQYAAEVDAVRKLYDDVAVKKLALSCLSAAGTPAERALDHYVAAANAWNACAAKPSCGTSRIEAPLQKEWRVAAHFLKQAKKGLQ